MELVIDHLLDHGIEGLEQLQASQQQLIGGPIHEGGVREIACPGSVADRHLVVARTGHLDFGSEFIELLQHVQIGIIEITVIGFRSVYLAAIEVVVSSEEELEVGDGL